MVNLHRHTSKFVTDVYNLLFTNVNFKDVTFVI